jgi:hypothetical protein
MAISTIGPSALDSGVSQLGKNLIINGAMAVAQRGTSFTSYGATNNAYSLDQYKISVSGSASARWTVTQESSGGVSGNAKWLKALVTTADTPGAAEGQAIIQRPEGQSIQALRRDGGGTKAATYSFDVIVHADGGSGLSFPVSLPVVFVIHDNVTDREIVSDVSVAAADTWERVTVSFPEDTSGGGPVNTSSAGSSVGITLAAGSNYVITADTWQNNTNVTLKTSSSDNFADATNNYVGFTEVQLEVGSVATDFEHEDYGTTLQKCYRYFQAITIDNNAGYAAEASASTSAYTATIPYISYNWRATPSASIRTNSNMRYRSYLSGFISATTSSTAGNGASPHAAGFYISCGGTLSGLTDGMPGLLNATGTMLVDFSAEL